MTIHTPTTTRQAPHENNAFIEHLFYQQMRNLSVHGTRDLARTFDIQFTDEWI